MTSDSSTNDTQSALQGSSRASDAEMEGCESIGMVSGASMLCALASIYVIDSRDDDVSQGGPRTMARRLKSGGLNLTSS